MTETEYISELQLMLSDDGSKNILNKKMPQYNETQLKFFLRRSLEDLNSGAPETNYTLEQFPEDGLILMGAVIYSCIAEGLLQLRNQLDYNDAGLSLAMFNKTGGYQGWVGFLLQTWMNDKADFKKGLIPNSSGAGFLGIRSQFSRDWGNY